MMTHPYETLKKLGKQLDADIFPRVKNGGIVTPSDTADSTFTWAKEITNERQGTRRPATEPWPGTARRQWETIRCWASGAAASPISAAIKTQYESELTAVCEAYPGTRVWQQDEGLWLLTESALLPGLHQKVIFLTGIPFSNIRTVRGWGFWVGGIMRHPAWIGPRHTNLPDGSICSFETSDGTWELGQSIVNLLDIYTLWALRQLHLQIFHRWPGRQVAHYIFERLAEIKPTELCGCGSSKQYSDCCLESDLNNDLLLKAMDFHMIGGFKRRPPDAVTIFIQQPAQPPLLADVLPWSI